MPFTDMNLQYNHIQIRCQVKKCHSVMLNHYASIYLVNPDAAEIETMAVDLDIPLVFITHALDIDESSPIETEKDTTLNILRTTQ